MKFFNNIEKMVKTFCADQKSTVMTTTEMDQRIINDSLLAHKKSNNEHSAANQQNIWKTIMKNRITKYAAAVVIILAVAIGITIISGSPPDLAHSAWAEIAKAMQRRSFVHVDIEGSQGEFSARIELWLLFESGIIHQKDYRDGSVVYTDPISNKHYIYHPNYDKIYVDENIITGDPIVRAPRFLQIRTPEELLENLLGTVPQEEITFEEGLYHGIEVEIYTAEWLDTTHPDPRERRNRKVEIIVDRNTHLPLEALSQTSYLEYSPGYLQVKVEKALFDYPEQGPADIYALGVPVDTEVMEQHPLEVAEVIERIDRRRQKGFGAMVAILTTSELDENLQPVKKTLELYGQADERIIYATYEFQTPDRHLWVPPSTMNLVTNWPRPDVYEVLQQGRNSLPNEAYVSMGRQAWRLGYWNQKPGEYSADEIKDPQRQEYLNSIFILSHKTIWPNGLAERIITAGGTFVQDVSLQRHATHPNYIVLYLEQINKNRAFKTVYTLDTARDDIPTEQILREYHPPDPETILWESHRYYDDYEQLRGEQWYPTQWHSISQSWEPGQTEPTVTRREYNLQIYADMELDDWWFTELVKKYK